MSCARGGLPFGLVRPGRTGFFFHHKELPEHRWFANTYDKDILYCCECNQKVPLKVFKYRPSQSAEASTELEANTNPLDPKYDEGLDKKEVVTPQMKPVEMEDKGSSGPSYPHSEDITKEPVFICQSEEIAKEDVAKYNVIRGLRNPGNACFFNAMLQCLLALDPLRSVMMGQNVCKGPIAALFKELFV